MRPVSRQVTGCPSTHRNSDAASLGRTRCESAFRSPPQAGAPMGGRAGEARNSGGGPRGMCATVAGMSSAQQRKAALRKQVAAAVDALSDAEVRRQSAIVADKVLKHPAYQKAKSVSIYLSFDKEVQTGSLVEDILKNGKTCYIPRFQKGIPEMDMIKLYSMEDYMSLPVNKWNIKQPAADDKRESVFENGTLDLVLAPGQAFTKEGIRLGRGKGYYDKFLAKCFKKLEQHPKIIGLAFKEQIILEIPQTETDIVVDDVLYEYA